MSQKDRVIRDTLFSNGFAKMGNGEYAEGLELLRLASGAEHLEVDPHGDYSPSTGVYTLSSVSKAARGFRGAELDPAALVFMGSEAEFKGFVERRTGESPDYRIKGYANHLGQAIQYYRAAERLRYPVAKERLDALRLKMGSADFQVAESAADDELHRGREHRAEQVKEIREAHGLTGAPTASPKQGGCYVATAVYGSYDCPEVWLLRRWRDSVLMKTYFGRAFVRAYYAFSPPAVRIFGGRAWLVRLTRSPLDLLVTQLKQKGFRDTPYRDL